MAHNLFRKNMAYVGQVPWHGLGTKVPADVNAEEMIKAAGLDWPVEKRPARGASVVWARKPAHLTLGAVIPPDAEVRYNRYELVRPPYDGQPNETVLGIVTDRYEPLQNADAFAFFDPIVDQKRACFETAGALGDGERIWVMAKMPGDIEVVRGDSCQKYLLLSNTHTGQGSVVVKFTAIRVVCQNTLMMSLDDGQAAFRVRHSKLMSDRLNEVGQLIATANAVYAAAATLFRAMAAMKLEADGFDKYLELVSPRSDAQKAKREEPERWRHVRQLFQSHEDLQLDGVRGTLWGAYNAITYFEDHKSIEHESAASRLDRVWFGGGAGVKLKALDKARELVGMN
jgi:phage/plasmid-like protein (TIGR03299 family)